jgi:DNA polymerase III delta subunit
MPSLTPTALRAQVTDGNTGPLYMLVGEDEGGKAAVAAEFLDLVDEELHTFNVNRLHGDDATADDLIHAASTLPIGAPRRVVLVLAAERLLIPKRESAASEAESERLEAFLHAPPAHATVVFVCGTVDQRRRIVKLLVREAQVVDCGTIQDAAGAIRWVNATAEDGGIRIDAAAVRALVERTGPHVALLRAGLERVALYALGQPSITADDVRASVAAGPEAQVDFGVAKAIWRGDAAGALRELHLAFEAGAVPVMVMGQLRASAEKLPSTRLLGAIDAVFRTDLALKSSGGEPRVLLERLVLELCGPHARSASWRGGR